MNEENIKRVEALVNEAVECNTRFTEETVQELNALTGNAWSNEDYMEYCSEYYSSNTLEETVYALFHDGNYPDRDEEDVYFMRTLGETDLSVPEIIRKIRSNHTDEKFYEEFPDLPIDDIYKWLYTYLENWETKGKDKEYKFKDSKKDSANFGTEIPNEYAKYKSILFMSYRKKLLNLVCVNLSKEEKRDIYGFIKSKGLMMLQTAEENVWK